MKFSQVWMKLSPEVIDKIISIEAVRSIALKKGLKELRRKFMEENEDNRPAGVQEGRCLMLQNLLHSVNRALSDGRISPGVRKAIVSNFIGRIILEDASAKDRFQAENGIAPPAFLTISPTKKCNLFCKGCYASSSSENAETLSYTVFNRIIKEMKEKWASHFTVISGGEPLLYKSEGKTLFDILAGNQDSYFMMYTNSTLITKDAAKRLADLGNLTPAISVEGYEAETDARRGDGTFKRIMGAMENLRNAGVPFGVSITATRHNAELVMEDRFIDYYFQEQGAIYGWIFQYMPIGRSYTTDLMITPEQRLAMFEREERLIRERNVFIVDFWNGGPYAVGCISAGRPGGYFYIDWNGNVAPCVFFPYHLANIYDLYREGKGLNDVLFSPYFKSIRKWQNDYGYTQPPHNVDNYIVPCPIRDHHENAFNLVREFGAKPMDNEAESALNDPEYHRKMAEYGKTVKSLTDEKWKSGFLNIKRFK